MLDIRKIYEDKEVYISNLNSRGKDYTNDVNKMVEIYGEYLQKLKATEDAQSLINEKSKLIGEYKRNQQDTTELMQEIADLKQLVAGDEVRELKKAYEDILYTLPNTVHADAPIGADEDENVLVRQVGEVREFDFEIKAHYEIGEALDGLDFERAAKLAKSRFVVTKGFVARLERAITNFMLDTHTKDGYMEFGVPVVVSADTMLKTGQLPKFADDAFKIARPDKEAEDEFNDESRDFYLIPTAEVALAGYHANEILTTDDLPLWYTSYSQCFRKEAGSAGRDTRGLIRMHQFGKVELFKYVHPDTSYQELDQMVIQAESILKALELPYRVVRLCTGDMGASAATTYDLEVWLPSQDTYRECSSCSNVEDFQARRGQIRFKDTDGQTKFVHMLNGSGMATGRILAAVLENYQNADQTVTIPDSLKPYME